tara:strand:+ start:922 stop:4272 length:3351 start_codon:yes stop_codon:yes gene_type:complete
MLTIYPSNRCEYLVTLLMKLMEMPMVDGDVSPLSALQPEHVVLQNAGIQHWLSMQLAEHQGVAMNIDYDFPAAFLWKMMRRVVPDTIDKENPYSREVMQWRIDALLRGDEGEKPVLAPARHYWQSGPRYLHELKRFQLASKLADLFEQYLMFRPQWIKAWEKGERVTGLADEGWQAEIWRLLTEQDQGHLLHWMEKSKTALTTPRAQRALPQRTFWFCLNTMPADWIDFLRMIGDVIDIHLFILNPSDEYWQDIQSEKSQARQRVQWLSQGQEEVLPSFTGNPLLASLGRQGQEFIHLWYAQPVEEIAVFDPPAGANVLEQIQCDILQLHDAREAPQQWVDDSIEVVSAHSALREVQGLHDWLLGMLNKYPDIQPRDILVMCPNVEDYAPYIDAVFSQYWEHQEGVAPLPCSIADRSMSDSEPMVQSFMQLLQLPDSRFSVTEIMALLQVPAITRRFGLEPDDIQRFGCWVESMGIHWGVDAKHQASLDLPDHGHYTWEQGLRRLLRGFVWGDEVVLREGDLLLPWVDGDDARCLGQFIALIELLEQQSNQLRESRKVDEWVTLLDGWLTELYDPTEDELEARSAIQQAINQLAKDTNTASYDEKLSLAVVRDYLSRQFSQPETRQRFLTGQITFCSMIPMRSVPFKIIAMLGLNDGDFPRQRQPLGFDLIAASGEHQMGDRSRRGDDRYLFLEGILSARKALYLSYQGHRVKDNAPRQPSLVLNELMVYLSQGYGWDFADSGSQSALHQLPLHPFSPANYQGDAVSFDPAWYQLMQRTLNPAGLGSGSPEKTAIQNLTHITPSDTQLHLTVENLIKALEHPCHYFAEQRLGVYFNKGASQPLSDSEPFEVNHLQRYLFQQDVIEQVLEGGDARQSMAIWLAGQQLPSTPNVPEKLDEWAGLAESFGQSLVAAGAQQVEKVAVVYRLGDIEISGELPVLDQQGVRQLLHWRLADPKSKDYLRLWLYHLLACHQWPELATQGKLQSVGWYRKGEKAQGVELVLDAVADPAQQLEQVVAFYQQLLEQPECLHMDLARTYYKKTSSKRSPKPFTARDYYSYWVGSGFQPGIGLDPYYQFFWPEPPTWTDALEKRLTQVYIAPLTAIKERLISDEPEEGE